MLGLNPSTARPAAGPSSSVGQRGGFQAAASRFLMPVQSCEFQLTQVLESLARDPWPVAHDRRPMRCTGVAMNIAVSMLEVC
jgi:protein transport protein SEC23